MSAIDKPRLDHAHVLALLTDMLRIRKFGGQVRRALHGNRRSADFSTSTTARKPSPAGIHPGAWKGLTGSCATYREQRTRAGARGDR